MTDRQSAPADSERTRRRRQAEERAKRALAAWKWQADVWPLWAFAGSLAVPEGGTKCKVEQLQMGAKLEDEAMDMLLFGRLAP